MSQRSNFAGNADQVAPKSQWQWTESSLDSLSQIFIFSWMYPLLFKTTSILPGILHFVCIFLHIARWVHCHSKTPQLFECGTNDTLFVHPSCVSLWSHFCCTINILILRTIIINKSWLQRQVILLFWGLQEVVYLALQKKGAGKRPHGKTIMTCRSCQIPKSWLILTQFQIQLDGLIAYSDKEWKFRFSSDAIT